MTEAIDKWAVVLGCWLVVACGSEPREPAAEPLPQAWSWVAHSPKAALLGVHGTSDSDVWLTGADDGQGPLLLHWDGSDWRRQETSVRGDLWWAHATQQGPVFFGGEGALVLRYEGGELERLVTPGLGKHTVFGISAVSPDDVYLVGAAAGRNGFIWHYDGESMSALELPADLPLDEHQDAPGLFKV